MLFNHGITEIKNIYFIFTNSCSLQCICKFSVWQPHWGYNAPCSQKCQKESSEKETLLHCCIVCFTIGCKYLARSSSNRTYSFLRLSSREMRLSPHETRVASRETRFSSRERVVTYFWAVLYLHMTLAVLFYKYTSSSDVEVHVHVHVIEVSHAEL